MEPRADKLSTYNITHRLARANPAYWSIVENIYTKSAATIIYRALLVWAGRDKSSLKNRHKYKQKHKQLNKTLSEPVFLQESWGTKSSEHADRINQGKWLELDFDDPQFVRNIFKALRLNKITLNHMVTAYLLHSAREAFHARQSGAIRQHKFFNEPGPYHPDSITYADEKQLRHFYKRISRLPDSEQCYFTVNFSKLNELAFFNFKINEEDHNTVYSDEWLKFFRQIPNANGLLTARNYISNDKWVAYYNEKMHSSAAGKRFNQDVRNKDSMKFLYNLLRINEQLPSIAISPDYDEKNPDSPVLCMIILSMPAFNALQHSLHRADTTDPFFTVGPISTRYIRKLDDENQSRPVELAHTDIPSNGKPHGYKSHSFLLSWHDIFHCWRNGANFYKPFFRHIREMYSRETGLYMSRPIWLLTDMDTSIGHTLRENFEKFKRFNFTEKFQHKLTIEMCMSFLAKLLRDIDNSDYKTLLLMDAALCPDKWTGMFASPKALFVDYEINQDTRDFLPQINLYKSLCEIISRYPGNSRFFYLLAYKINVMRRPERIDFCYFFAKISLNQIIRWDTRYGLVFIKDYDFEDLDMIQCLCKAAAKLYKKGALSFDHIEIPEIVKDELILAGVRKKDIANKDNAKAKGCSCGIS